MNPAWMQASGTGDPLFESQVAAYRDREIANVARIFIYKFMQVVERGIIRNPPLVFFEKTPLLLLPRTQGDSSLTSPDMYLGSRRILQQSLYKYCLDYHGVNIYDDKEFDTFQTACAYVFLSVENLF